MKLEPEKSVVRFGCVFNFESPFSRSFLPISNSNSPHCALSFVLLDP